MDLDHRPNGYHEHTWFLLETSGGKKCLRAYVPAASQVEFKRQESPSRIDAFIAPNADYLRNLSSSGWLQVWFVQSLAVFRAHGRRNSPEPLENRRLASTCSISGWLLPEAFNSREARLPPRVVLRPRTLFPASSISWTSFACHNAMNAASAPRVVLTILSILVTARLGQVCSPMDPVLALRKGKIALCLPGSGLCFRRTDERTALITKRLRWISSRVVL